ncbi:ADP-L-glycero-D-manno-heptose-6-epimerase [Pseudomonas psychrophila]|nr:ADP-L-glycero-D-manno-heptose-6-epimerase [Pseudomonas psychrophila]
MLVGVMRYCEFPLGLKHKYQVYTCADLTQLREAGYCEPMMGLEEGGATVLCRASCGSEPARSHS